MSLSCILHPSIANENFTLGACDGDAREEKPGDAMQDCEQQARPAPLEPFRLHRTRDTYVADVQACKDALYAGESYELCLTTALSRRSAAPHNALDLYYTLRRVSPAPYAAFMSFGDGGPQVRSFVHLSE